MNLQQQVNSICASFSDFCSVGERVQGNREQLLTRQNQRLRKQYSEVSEKYMKMCNQLTKTQKKMIDKERKISELDLFYKREIETLKKQISLKSNQIIKLTRIKNRKINLQNKQNYGMNSQQSQYLQNCLQNQSSTVNKLQQQNQKLNLILIQVLEICQPHIKSKQCLQICKRVSQIRRQLNQKINVSGVLEKANDIITDLKKGTEKQGQLANMMNLLKAKTNQLKKTPVIFDYDLQSQSKNLEILFTDLDIQMRLQKSKKNDSN